MENEKSADTGGANMQRGALGKGAAQAGSAKRKGAADTVVARI